MPGNLIDPILDTTTLEIRRLVAGLIFRISFLWR